MILTTWPDLFHARDGREFETTAETFVARVRRPKTYGAKSQWPRYALASFRDGHRCLDAFEAAEAIVLDFDRGATGETIGATFGELCGFGHSTKRSMPGAERWRVCIYLDRPVDGEEFPRVWRAVAALAEGGGLEPDYAARDASRAWAAPGAGPHYRAIELCGAFFNVATALERFPPPAPPSLDPPVVHSDDLARRVERARRYLGTMDGAISGSCGHTATIRAASALVVGFDLPLDVALDILWRDFNPRCQPPWSLPELRHKVRSAERDARQPRGWLADARRSA